MQVKRVIFGLINSWERLYYGSEQKIDVLDRTNLNKKDALEYIEKNLEIDLYGFLMTEAFNDFYVVYHLGGQVEANLAAEVDEVKYEI